MVLPSEGHRHNTSPVLSDLQESRFCHVKMRAGRVAPATIVTWQCVVWRAEVGCGHHDGAGKAPLLVIVALDLVARTATGTVIKERRAERCCVCAVSLAVHIPIATCSTCTYTKNVAHYCFSMCHLQYV